jgi:hypothetical protein
MGGDRNCTRFRWESPKERDHSKDHGLDGKMESEIILGRFSVGVWNDSVGSG